jgi:hypothetical protein
VRNSDYVLALQQGRAEPPTQPKGVWWGPIGFAIIGVLSLVAYLNPTSPPVTERDLTCVSGKPTEVEVYSRAKRRGSIECLKFRVDKYRAYISEYNPKYEDVRSALQNGDSLTAWFATNGNYGDTDERPLHKLAVGNRMILSFDDSVAEEKKSHDSLLIVGTAFMAIAALTTGIVAWKVHRYESFMEAYHKAAPTA